MNYVLMNDTHVTGVVKLEQACFSAPWSENAIRSELHNSLSLWIVAEEAENVVGYIGSQSVLGEADVMNLAVDRAYRRNGVGEQLVNTLISHLQKNGVKCLTLEVRASNEAAIQLYDKLGFLQVGRRPGYYSIPREDALIFRKEWDV